MAETKTDPGAAACSIREEPCLAQAAIEIGQYLSGTRRDFTVRLDPRGTPFQITVWQELFRILYGKTCSYSDIATRIDNPKAARAVGTANGKNPLSLIVSCHRVVAAHAGLGDYAGGIDRKGTLLQLERDGTFSGALRNAPAKEQQKSE